MRVIKFRAWDKNGAFINGESGKAEPHMIYDVGVSVRPSRLFGGIHSFTDEGRLHVSPGDENLILMQFTGRRDIDGKEIYEGDIVKSDQEPAQVVYSELQMMFYLKGRFGPLEAEDRLEVIGNIYEHPEWRTYEEASHTF